MNTVLFDNIDSRHDNGWIVKSFFNSIYSQGKFLWALPSLVSKAGCGVNEDYCAFPDFLDPDPELHFFGVKIGVFRDEVIISDDEFERILDFACDRYCALHPEDAEQLTDIRTKAH